MKIGCLADLHLTSRTPETRTDSYTDAILEKLEKTIDLFENAGCEIVVCAGDFLDTEKEPYRLVNYLIDYFRKRVWARNNWFFSVAGQHDQVNHTLNLENTPYQTLVASGCIEHLGKHPRSLRDGVYLYGCSWGEKIPKIVTEGEINILVIHKMIVQEKIWEGQENVVFGKDFLKENKFDFIVSGDNHKPFTEIYRGRVLINCGSLGRLKSDQRDYQPYGHIIDTDKPGDFDKIKIPLKNKSVFDIAKKVKKKANKKELEAFIETLDKRSVKMDFRDKIEDKKSKIKNPDILSEIDSVLSGQRS